MKRMYIKQVLSAFLAVMLCFAFSSVALADENFVGEGIDGDPFIISNADDLFLMASLMNNTTSSIRNLYRDKHYALENDIDISDRPWTPISTSIEFTGVFDGQNHVIIGLTVTSITSYAGLFSQATNATIRNLGMIDVDITARNSAGGVSGRFTGGLIENVYVTGKLTAESNVGGIVGNMVMASGVIQNSYADVDLISSNYTGGIAGLVGSANTIRNCYSNGTMFGRQTAGGIAGVTNGPSSVTGSFSTAKIEVAERTGNPLKAGGIVGFASNIGQSSTIKIYGNVALNPSVTSPTRGGVAQFITDDDSNRIVVNFESYLIYDNYAWEGLALNGERDIQDLDELRDGITITTLELLDRANWPEAFQSEEWLFTPGMLPIPAGIAEAFGFTGVAYPEFLEAELPSTVEYAEADAVVTKMNGNKNLLTIVVYEVYSNGVSRYLGEPIVANIEINNNAVGTYDVGEYKVYVDTKGNTQIRECYIVQ